MPLTSDLMSAGASSFGMSGVNAHALLAPPKVLAHTTSEVDWQRERYWMAPSPHHTLSSVQYSRQAGQCRLAPSLHSFIACSQLDVYLVTFGPGTVSCADLELPASWGKQSMRYS